MRIEAGTLVLFFSTLLGLAVRLRSEIDEQRSRKRNQERADQARYRL